MKSLEKKSLYISSAPCQSAEEALRLMPGGNDAPHILLCTPSFCGFADASLRKSINGRDIADADDVFEMRCFCPEFDLRWHRCGAGGRAVLLSDERIGAFPQVMEYKDAERISGHYILWGSGTGGKELFEHRIGAMPVPIAVSNGSRVLLNYAEYFTPDEQYGNMLFRAERLISLEIQAQSA